MHQYYYELQIYEDLINGEMTPFRLKGDKLQLGRKYLDQEVGQCQDMQLLKVKRRNKKAEVIEKLNITNAHPLAKMYFHEPEIAFEENIHDILSKEIASELHIDNKNLVFTTSKLKNNVYHIGICQNSTWSKIAQQRIKYCYYFQMLSDCQRKLKRSLHLAVYELEEENFKKLVSNIQKTLLYYLSELQKEHVIDPNLIDYQIKESYTNQDCVSLIYISLIEQLNHLYENYHSAFDKSYLVPYYSEIINVNQIDEKINFIRTTLQKQGIDPLLMNVLNEQFDRIMRFDHPNRLTYHELDYFIEFLSNLAKFIAMNKEKGITADRIVTTLISYQFNSFKFIQYLTNEIRMDLATIQTFQEKRLYLLTQKKMVEQCIVAIKKPFDPKSNCIRETLCDWIEKEKQLVEEHIQLYSDETTVQKTETYKIETSFTAKQLAVFIKILSDGDIIISKSQSELARWISANFKTANCPEISITQMRNNLYNKDPDTLERIRQTLIEMRNILNEMSNLER